MSPLSEAEDQGAEKRDREGLPQRAAIDLGEVRRADYLGHHAPLLDAVLSKEHGTLSEPLRSLGKL